MIDSVLRFKEISGYHAINARTRAAIRQLAAEIRAEENEACAQCVPNTWLDPLLSGKESALPPIGDKIKLEHIVSLLVRISDDIRSRMKESK